MKFVSEGVLVFVLVFGVVFSGVLDCFGRFGV